MQNNLTVQLKFQLLRSTVITIIQNFHLGVTLACDIFWENPLRAIIIILWEIELFILKIQFVIYCIIYDLFMNTYVGQILFSCAIVPSYGLVEQNSPWLLICYYIFIFEGYIIYLICKMFPSFYDLLKEHFGSEFLKTFAGNTIFNKIRRPVFISLAYPVIRALDERHNASLVNDTFDKLHEKLKTASDWGGTKEEFYELRSVAKKDVGQPLLHKLEQTVATGVFHGFAKIGEGLSKKDFDK